MHVLVTGAAGFVGSVTVATLLDAGHGVRALDVLPGVTASGVEWLAGDLADPAVVAGAVADVDAIVHLASGHWIRGLPVVSLVAASVATTAALYQAAADVGVTRVVLMSSGAVVTGHKRGTRIDRVTPPAFQGTYPLAKWLQEEVARRCAAGAARRVLVSPILRPWVVVDAPTRTLRTGTPIDRSLDPLDHDGCFGWIDRADLAMACLRALEADITGAPVYHLMPNPIGGLLFDTAPAHDELGWQPRLDFAADIPAGWTLPDGWPVAA